MPADFATIQAALNAASNGDVVLVQPGLYIENITWPETHGVQLISAGDSSNTTIDGNNTDRVIYFPAGNYYDSTTIVRGFKITNGHIESSYSLGGGIALYDADPLLIELNITGNKITSTSWAYGGGVYCSNSSPNMRYVQIAKNKINSSGWAYGGGIYCTDSNPQMRYVQISSNESQGGSTFGGGIYCTNSNPQMEFVQISNNVSHGVRAHGGGMYCTDNTSPVLSNVVISSNQLNSNAWCSGGGIYCTYSSSPMLSNVTISSNRLNSNRWCSGGGMYCNDNSSPTLVNVFITSNILGDSASSYSGGGIYCDNNSSPILINVLIALQVMANSGNSYSGGAIFCRDSSNISLTNVTMTENKREGGSSITGSGICCVNSSANISNTISWNDNSLHEIYLSPSASLTANHSNIRGGWSGIENINSDPLFISDTNFNLQLVSPCVNTGTLVNSPRTDIENNHRPINIKPDIGAYEVQNCSSTTANISVTACETYTLPSGNAIHDSSGVYLDTILNVSGCDSILTIDLTINLILDRPISTHSQSACPSYTSPSGNNTWNSSGTYMDTIPMASGCDSIIRIELEITSECDSSYCLPFVPNVITPNSDGINDCFEITNHCSDEGFQAIVFNRWGQAIWTSTNSGICWDGHINGQIASEGIYYYRLTIAKKSFMGSFSLFHSK